MDTSTRGSCSASVLKEYLEALNVLKLPTLQILEEEDVDGGAFLLLTEDYLRLNFATIKSGERLKVLNLVEQFKLAPPHIFVTIFFTFGFTSGNCIYGIFGNNRHFRN